MKTVIGRDKEIKELQQRLDSKKAEFIAIYGRRRVGKTYLVTQLLGDKLAFDMTGVIDGTRDEQLFYFSEALLKAGYEFSEGRPKNWLEAFSALEHHLEKQPAKKQQILFIDELPCLDTPKSGFVKAFDHFWNAFASRRPGLKLIVCGSATTWMVGNLINNKGGLHNRITFEMHLSPFSLYEVEQYLKANGFDWSRFLIVQAYMIFGGVPYYLSLLNKNESLAQNIDRLFFSKGELQREYDRLYTSLFRNSEFYMRVIMLLANTKKGLSREDIIQKLKSHSGGQLSKVLSDLLNCDFVRCYYVRKKRGVSKSVIYQLTDFFTLFHYKYGMKAVTDTDYWSKLMHTSEVLAWQGLAFEKICLTHVNQIKKALGIDRIYTDCYSWRSKESERGAQIDLLIDRADNMINLCEIKFLDTPYILGKEELNKILNRKAVFSSELGLKSGINLTMITPFGLSKNTYSDNIQSVITLDDLFLPG
jgi:hypothetical protein